MGCDIFLVPNRSFKGELLEGWFETLWFGKSLLILTGNIDKNCILAFERLNEWTELERQHYRKKKLPAPAEKITHKNMHVSTRYH